MIVSIGDSVLWGQGLREEEKFDQLLARWHGSKLLRLAHSGAILGSAEEPPHAARVEPEIPVSYPSLWQQIHSCNHWSEADLVLINGGMNDVDLRKILHPWSSPAELAPHIDRICREHMQSMLLHLAPQLVRPGARIVVLGYYPILSRLSRYPGRHHPRTLLKMYGIHVPSLVPEAIVPIKKLMRRVEDNCVAFWRASDAAFAQAVESANNHLPSQPCVFVPLPFSEQNALWAPSSMLFELTEELGPEDPVRAGRAKACALTYRRLRHPFKRIQCDRASAGHPNVEGSALAARALIATLGKAISATP